MLSKLSCCRLRLLSPGQTIATYQHNISQYCWTRQHLQALAKQSQHFNATDRNIAGHNMLHAFGHPVATCCDMLRVENRTSAHAQAQHCCTNLAKRLQHHATSTNVAWKIWPFSNLSQHHPTCRNTSQQGCQTHATCCTQQCCDMLRSVKCCDRLAGALRLLLLVYYGRVAMAKSKCCSTSNNSAVVTRSASHYIGYCDFSLPCYFTPNTSYITKHCTTGAFVGSLRNTSENHQQSCNWTFKNWAGNWGQRQILTNDWS